MQESLTIAATPVSVKVSRLYVVSDVLHNSSAAVKNAAAFRSEFHRVRFGEREREREREEGT